MILFKFIPIVYSASIMGQYWETHAGFLLRLKTNPSYIFGVKFAASLGILLREWNSNQVAGWFIWEYFEKSLGYTSSEFHNSNDIRKANSNSLCIYYLITLSKLLLTYFIFVSLSVFDEFEDAINILMSSNNLIYLPERNKNILGMN